MTLAPSRIGLCFALALALPATFAAAWAVLQHGGTIERARADERAEAERALQEASAALDEALQVAAAHCTFPLQLDQAGRVVGPFSIGSEAAPTMPIGIAEQTADARLAAGEPAAAQPFFAHAAADGSLSPEGWLRHADLLAAIDLTATTQALASALERYPAQRCGGLPFPLLVLLRRARLRTTPAELLRDEFVRLVPTVPAAAVGAVVDEFCAAVPQHAADQRWPELRLAATVALRGFDADEESATPGPDGSVLLRRHEQRLAVVPSSEVGRCRDRAYADARVHHPQLAVTTLANEAAEVDENAAQLAIAPLGETWVAQPTGPPTSVLLQTGARLSLGLAIATFVLGNLLVWRLMRRELALVRLRTDFVDTVSHELRTPLAALSLKAEMLAQGDVPAARAPHYLRTLHHDVQRLTDQVERILDFGRLERGAPLQRVPIPARDVLARGLRAGRSSLRLVGQRLEVEAPRSLPPLRGDVDVLARALRNLLENAAKYAPPGSPVAVRAFADQRQLMIEVADRGPGVPPAERQAIFQPFVRSSTTPPGTPGSGLGLALVAAAARAHGGKVEVHTRDGGGAVFTLTLPIAAAERAS